ncbi:hypothetical protein [uncultured Hyphomicrobium sp.]|jgi:hypothetical protein|uniref:hypothetical protein n=1 Tax=uncultured Hyphomicrobium sp. TaxID=194373 RepID=UPI0025E1BB98|nr:hypothetical protein [uncultured Hyphomicrobium sp.]
MQHAHETHAPDQAAPKVELDDEDRSKDAFFAEVGDVANRMIEAHGKDFAMGVLIIGARFIAEGKPLARPT